MGRRLKWLYPGLGVKRWLALALVGLLLIIVGTSGLLGSYWSAYMGGWLGRQLWELVMRSPAVVRLLGALLAFFGLACLIYGLSRVVRAIVHALLPEQEEQLVDILVEHNLLNRAPNVVVIGGGTGMPVVLRGLKNLTSNLTAIVTMADDGGSSGRLRGELGILPPGDIRNCLIALATTESLLEDLFQHRFRAGTGIEGHSFGNLFIAAMSEITGDFDLAVKESSKVLAVRGRVLPVTLQNIVLCAETTDGRIIRGESSIPQAEAALGRVYTVPEQVEASPEALAAIEGADLIVLGPGSLYTSVIPNLIIPGVAEAIRASRATKVYVCNLMTQPGETNGYTASQHLQAIYDHTSPGLVDYVLVNTAPIRPELLERYRAEGADVVLADVARLEAMGVTVLGDELITQEEVVRHDPERVAAAVFRLARRKRLR